MLKSIENIQSNEEKCKVVMENWGFVITENEREKDFVSESNWEHWVRYRDDMNKKMSEVMDNGSNEDIVKFFLGLQGNMLGAKREEFTRGEVVNLPKSKLGASLRKFISW